MSNKNIYQLVKSNAIHYPSKSACIFQSNIVTYKELITLVDKLAGGLHTQGVKQGNVIALFLPNNIDFAVCMLAAAKLGVAIAPLPLTLKGEALQKAMVAANCDYVIAWTSVARQLETVNCIANENIIVVGQDVGSLKTMATIMSIEEVNHFPEVSPELPYILTMTSGSTGDPKPIVFTQQTKINRAFKATGSYYKLDSDDIILVSTPLYHSLAQRSLLMPLMLGGTAVILPKFSVQYWVDTIAKEKVTFLFAVSNQLKTLLPALPQADLRSLKCVVSSSATLDKADKVKLLKEFKCHFHECYGTSEVGVISDFDVTAQEERKLTSVGKPMPFLEVKICDKNRDEVNLGVVGEITCKSPTRFEGYYQLPEKTAQSVDSEGFFFTGDLGYLDADGYLYYVGREKEVIKSGGINVYPSDVELVISRLSWIDESAAMGIDNQQFGEVILLAFSLNLDAPKDYERQIRILLLEQLTDYQQPRILFHLKDLPKTGMGKIHKPSIKELYKNKISV